MAVIGAYPFPPYDAIICYADYDFDRKAAQTLRDQIAKYKPPRKNFDKKNIQERFDQIYLETVEEAQFPNLNTATKTLLDNSAFLIIVCSPRAKESVRLNQIIEYFKNTSKEEHILPLLIEGNPFQAFPPSLFSERTIPVTNRWGGIEEIKDEPLATDIRAASVNKSLARIRQMRLKIIAAIIGCSYDDLEQRHLKRIRQRVIMATTLFAAVSLSLILIFTYLRFNALLQENIAKQQTKMAVNLLNSMLRDLPEKFKDIPDAKPILEELLLDNIGTLRITGSQSIQKINIEDILRINPSDSTMIILRKGRLLRDFGWKSEALQALNIAQKQSNSKTVLTSEYFKSARFFTQAGFVQGEYVDEVAKDMPAAINGLMPGDIIIEMNAEPVGEYNDIGEITNQLPYDSLITITYIRWQKSGSYFKRSFQSQLQDGMLGIVYQPI